MIIASGMMDIIVVNMIGIFAIHGHNPKIMDQPWRIPLELALFYGFRFVV